MFGSDEVNHNISLHLIGILQHFYYCLSAGLKMDRLPYELLSSIFKLLSRDDVVNLPYSISRKGLSGTDVASGFRTFHDVWINEKSLQSLLRASKHPLIGPAIEELVFVFDRFAEISNKKFKASHQDDHYIAMEGRNCSKHWRRDTFHSPPCVDKDDTFAASCCTEKELERKWTHYRKLYLSRQHLADSGGDARILTAAMKCLPTVSSILLDNYYNDLNSKPEALSGDAWCFHCGHDPVDDSGVHLMKVILNSLADSGLKLRRLRVRVDGGPNRW